MNLEDTDLGITSDDESPMSYKECSAYVMPFGKFQGLTLQQFLDDEEALCWLDWIQGEDIKPPASIYINRFLEFSHVEREVQRAVDEKEWRYEQEREPKKWWEK